MPEPVTSQGLGGIDRMLDVVASHPTGLATPVQGLVRDIGAA